MNTKSIICAVFAFFTTTALKAQSPILADLDKVLQYRCEGLGAKKVVLKMELASVGVSGSFALLQHHSNPEVPLEPALVSSETPTEAPFEHFALQQNYPNPFNPSTTLSFQLPAATHVAVTVHNITGRKVAELLNAFKPAGEHTLQFNATGLASGTYLYRVQAGKSVLQRKMLLLK